MSREHREQPNVSYREAAEAAAEHLPVLRDVIPHASNGRCYACNWPLKATPSEGCTLFNCAYRPGEHHSDYPSWRIRADRQWRAVLWLSTDSTAAALRRLAKEISEAEAAQNALTANPENVYEFEMACHAIVVQLAAGFAPGAEDGK